MPSPPFAPSVFFDEADIDALVAEFSQRVRRSPSLRPAMIGLIGNRWEEAEAATAGLLRATLFLEQRPVIDGDWLVQSVTMLSAGTIDQLADILLDCALVALPLHSAAVVAEIGEQLACLFKAIVAQEGAAQDRLLLKVRSRLLAGALMSRF